MSVMVLLQSADMINQREMAIDKGNHSSHDDCRNHRSRAQPLQMVKEEQGEQGVCKNQHELKAYILF